MAEMIPGTYRGTSSSERKVFDWISACKLNGLVIHNVRYESPRLHEADFIVISRRGILVLEVKGGYVSWNRMDDWTTIDRNNVKHACNNPYEQAFTNTKELHNRMKKDLQGIDTDCILWSYGVILPDTDILPVTIEAIPSITFLSADDPNELSKFIGRCYDYALSKVVESNPSARFPVIADSLTLKLKEYLCGSSGILRDLKRDIEDTEERIIVATQEQYKVLSVLAEAERLIVKGGAGSGKTLIALEQSIRLSNKGLKVLFLTYNKLLMQFLVKEAAHEGIDFVNFDRLIYESINAGAKKEDSEGTWAGMSPEESQRLWNEHRPNAFIRQGGLSGSRRYDAVIVDEAQDILNLRRRLECIDLMVKGGLAKGRVYFFFDEAQHLFNTGDADELEESIETLIKKYNFLRIPLGANCRNTAQIAEFARLATGFGDPPDKDVINSNDSVEAAFYTDNEEKLNKVVGILTELKDKGINGGDILILSHRGSGNPNSSLAYQEMLSKVYPVKELNPDNGYDYGKDVVKLSNIYRYKGLQEKIVIVTDVEQLEREDGRPQRENYACFTRAKAKLYVVANSCLKSKIEEIIEASR